MSVLIRAARPDDVTALIPLFEQWGHARSTDEIAAVLAEWRDTVRSEVLLADVEGDIAGMTAVSAAPRFAEPGRYAHLAGMVVAIAHRRRGFGALLLHAAEELARAWNCDRLELTSSRSREAAHDFYRARGYEETSAQQARYVRLLGPSLDASEESPSPSGAPR